MMVTLSRIVPRPKFRAPEISGNLITDLTTAIRGQIGFDSDQ